MIDFELDDSVIVEQRKALEAAMSTNPKTANVLRKLIRQVVMEARAKVVGDAKNAMKKDPRGAAKAIRSTVYKKILGANINILNSRKAHGSNSYEPTRNPSRVGGNRRMRSARTQQLMGYDSLDRGFILRWLNSGANDRVIQFRSDDRRERVNRGARGGSLDKYGQTTNTGKRGTIAARNFFRNAGDRELREAAERLAMMIDAVFEETMNT